MKRQRQRANRIYINPGGKIPGIYNIIMQQSHTLVAGTTGSGKSTAIHGLINAIITARPPAGGQLVLIDPKRVELCEYAGLPHTIGYADTYPEIRDLIRAVSVIMESRFQWLQRNREKQIRGQDIYVIIDEYLDLKVHLKGIEKDLISIASLGRAAGIHLILATQRPTRDVITGPIRANFPCVLGLRTASPQESRNVINMAACADLPLYGHGYLLYPEVRSPELWRIPPVDPAETQKLIDWYR